jgi:hypothetical protein
MVREYLKKAVKQAKANKKVFGFLAAVVFVAELLSLSSSHPVMGTNPFIVFVGWLTGPFSYYWLMQYVLVSTKKSKITIKDVFVFDGKKLLRLLGMYIIALLVFMVVLIPTVIVSLALSKAWLVMGIIISTILIVVMSVFAAYAILRYQFAPYALLDQKSLTIRKAFAYSWLITKNKLKKIIWFEIKYAVVSFLLIIPVFLPMALYLAGRTLLANVLVSGLYSVFYIVLSQAFCYFYRSLEKKKK